MKMKTKKILVYFLCAFIISSLFQGVVMAKDYSTVRIKLSNVNDGTLNFYTNGKFQIKENGTNFDYDLLVSVDKANKNQFIVAKKSNNQVIYRGKSVNFINKSGTLRVYTLENGKNGYLGDMNLSINNGQFTIINTLPLEKYLLGVVAYEMNNNFPVEALKAQAIAARGYAVSKLKPTKSYDLLDTPQDQVYKGYDPANKNVISAVNATAGQVMTHNNKIIEAYYSASNGGQTDLTANVWGNSLPYYDMKDDPYDLRNPVSEIEKVFFPRDVSASGIDPKLESFVKAMISPKLKEKGYSIYSDNIEILGFSKLEGFESKYPEPSRVFTKAKGTVDLHVTGATGDEPEINISQPKGEKPKEPKFKPATNDSGEQLVGSTGPLYVDESGNTITYEEMISLMDDYNSAVYDWENGVSSVLEESGSTTQGNTQKISMDFEFVLYDLKDTTKPYKIFTKPFLRMYYTEEVEDGFNAVNARFGHGVGMSQRGAQQMAKEGLTYKDILDFYYPNTTIKKYDTTSTSNIPLPEGNSDDQSNIEEVDVDNEVIPEDNDVELEEIDVFEPTYVKLKAAKDVKVMSSAGGGSATASVKAGTTLHLLAHKGSYFRVATNSGKTGYIKISDTTLITNENPVIARTNKKINAYSDVTLKKSASSIESSEIFEITKHSGNAAMIKLSNGTNSYINLKDVEILIENINIKLESSKFFGQTVKSVIIYKEKVMKTKVATLPKNFVVEVINKVSGSNAYSINYNGKKAYISSDAIRLLKKGSVHPNPSQLIKGLELSASNESAASQVQGTITGVTVNLRSKPSTNSPIIVQIAKGEKVTVIEQTGSFYKIKTAAGKTGYVSKDFVSVKLKEYGEVKAVTVRLRKSASTKAATITILPKGEKVTLLGTDKDFYKVETSNKTVGYISKEYLTVKTESVAKGSAASAGSAAPQNNSVSTQNKPVATGIVNASNVNVRASASSGAKILLVLKKGDKVNIYATNKEFYKITVGNVTGYVAKSYIGSLKRA